MKRYTVQQLSKLAGVSVRTLHYYDSIGLLTPSDRSEKNYRFYTRVELLRLQQILFYRELDIPLKEIAQLMDEPEYNAIGALEEHKQLLLQKGDRIRTLIHTIDKTINTMKDNNNMTDEELYEGFSKETVNEMREGVKERWGEDSLITTENKIRGWGKERWKDVKQQGVNITKQIASLMHLGAAHKDVQLAIAQHFEYVNLFNETDKERYLLFGKMYAEDERFAAYYEGFKQGLAQFMQEAIEVFYNNDSSAQ